jgi:ring-1,2-phenylacetyl-CoA epoxidase subunit PaaD
VSGAVPNRDPRPRAAYQATPRRPTAWQVAASVLDPELPSVTIEELGVLRDVEEDPATGRVTVTITPTYAGCPAMDAIRSDIRRALSAAGYPDAAVQTVLQPTWSTDMISESGRAKLAAAGIAPPARGPASRAAAATITVALGVRCPRCGSVQTQEISWFGSTPCKALRRCLTCAEPFEQVKPV